MVGWGVGVGGRGGTGVEEVGGNQVSVREAVS